MSQLYFHVVIVLWSYRHCSWSIKKTFYTADTFIPVLRRHLSGWRGVPEEGV